jgi:Ca2+-binding EF-hand superfamily protein
MPSSLDQYVLQELREAFNQFDRNGDGSIDKAEFTELMTSIDPDMGQEEIDIGFKEVDLDGSGSIEFGEFLNWWQDR